DDFVDGATIALAIARLPVPGRLVPLHALGERYILSEVHADKAWPLGRPRFELLQIEIAAGVMGDDAIGHALFANEDGQSAGVDAAESDNSTRLEPLAEMPVAAVIGGIGDGGLDDAAAYARCRGEIGRLDIILIGPVIADMGEGEGDDLAGRG